MGVVCGITATLILIGTIAVWNNTIGAGPVK